MIGDKLKPTTDLWPSVHVYIGCPCGGDSDNYFPRSRQQIPISDTWYLAIPYSKVKAYLIIYLG